MKKTILLSIILFTFSLITNAQLYNKESFFRIGAKGGVNVNKIDGRSYKQGFNYNFQAGVFAQIKLTKKIGLQPEVNFVQTSSEYTDDANIIYEDLVGGGSQHKAKLDI